MTLKRWLPVLAVGLVIGTINPGSRAKDQQSALVAVHPVNEQTAAAYEAWRARHPGYNRPSREKLENKLTPLQYRVTQEDGTERPFRNEYWDNKRDGIYVDIVSGEPLFSSTDKYKSGTGWPSFTRPVHQDAMLTREDRSWFSLRTELRSSLGDSHLGHVFEDGPAPTGLRYCINSASLRFIPKENLEHEGYGEFLTLFNR